MKKKENIILGIILIIIGFILIGKTLNIIHINIFFKGWWTLFIIIPSLIGLFNDHDKTGSLIGLTIGLLLLLATRNVVDLNLVIKLAFPIVIIVIGLSLVLKNLFDSKIDNDIKNINDKNNNSDNYYSAFSSKNIKLDNETFSGSDINAIFGSVKLDLSEAIIKDDIVINASSIFGGIDIIVPENMLVKIKSNSFFGGISNNKKAKETKNSKTIYINATCLFGGVNIK